jgi:light-regulated signal transduction histidine kinase (bacteriophytochrome)
MRVALDNLLGNAWKFTAKTPRARIEVGSLPGQEVPTYFVRDNGAGFDMTYVHKLFGAFQRLHAEADFPGTGIGLATVYRIIDRHAGRVWAEAAIGQGAAFFFTLCPERTGGGK